MNCEKADKLSLKYELGELDFFQKKSFEKHIKRCSRCKKRYASVLLLGGLLLSAKKVYTPSLIKLIMSSFIVKLMILSLIGTGTVVGVNSAYKNHMKEKIVEISSDFSESAEKESFIKASEKKEIKRQNGIMIRAVDGDKEIELRLNDKYEIEKRTEK